MRRQGLVWAAAAVVALVAAACFSDPTSSLRNGATRLQLSQYTVTLRAGDSLSVRAYVLDDQGNQLDVGSPTWTSADPTIASVHADPNVAPGDVFGNGIVVGVNNFAGITDVTVNVQGVQGTVRVTVLPAVFPGVKSVTGTAQADTVIISRPAPLPPLVVPYTVGDTLVLNSTSTVNGTITFNAATSGVNFGAFAGYVVSRSATQLKVMSRQPFAGKPVVTNVIYSGNATTGPIAIATMPVDSINLQHSRFHGVINVTGDTLTLTAAAGSTFGATTGITFYGVPGTANPASAASVFSRTATTIRAIAPILNAATYNGGFIVTKQLIGAVSIDSANSTVSLTMNKATYSGTAVVSPDTLVVTPPVVGNFNTDTTGGKKVTALKFGGSAGIVFLTDTVGKQMKVLSNSNYTGTVTVLNVRVGSVMVDSLATTGSISINKAVFPGAVANGAGRLLDTIVVASTSAAKFKTGSGASTVQVGGQTALLISRTTDTMKVIAVLGSSAGLTVTNVVVGASLIPALTTAGAVNVSTVNTGEFNEPGNNSRATPDTLKFVGAADTITWYGSVDCEDDGSACPGNGDSFDYYLIANMTTTQKLRAIVNWYGTGTGGNPYGTDHTNPDIDVLICVNTGVSCTYNASDLTGFSGAGNVQPEIATTGAVVVPNTFWVRVFGYSTPSPIGYRLRVLRL